MLLRCAAAIFVMLIATVHICRAQYEMSSPAPRSTSRADMQAAARDREVHERFRLGLAAEQRRDWNAAIAEFTRIRNLHPAEPKNSTAAYDLSIAFVNAHRLDDAESALKDAMRDDPGFLAAYANLITVELLRGDTKDARTYADKFIALAPDSARALYARGLVALQTRDYRTAISDFGNLLSINPAYAVAHYDLGVAESGQQRYSEAQREFESALSLAPNYARARFALAMIFVRQGDRKAARRELDVTVRDAGNDVALRNLANAVRDELH